MTEQNMVTVKAKTPSGAILDFQFLEIIEIDGMSPSRMEIETVNHQILDYCKEILCLLNEKKSLTEAGT